MATKAATKKGKAAKDTADAMNTENPASNPRDNSVSAAELAAKLPGDDKGKGLLAADAQTAERMEAEDETRKADEDNSVAGRLARSGYLYHENQITGERWVGTPIQQDDSADLASKQRTRVTSLSEAKPFTGLTIKPKDGEPFAVPEEFGGREATPKDWLAILNPATKKPFIE